MSVEDYRSSSANAQPSKDVPQLKDDEDMSRELHLNKAIIRVQPCGSAVTMLFQMPELFREDESPFPCSTQRTHKVDPALQRKFVVHNGPRPRSQAPPGTNNLATVNIAHESNLLLRKVKEACSFNHFSSASQLSTPLKKLAAFADNNKHFIVEFHDVVLEQPLLIAEWCEFGDLRHNHHRRRHDPQLLCSDLLRVATQILEALRFLHDTFQIVHFVVHPRTS
ncbi:hypothetical protein B0H66DRAFT_587729 [Apodospora peruviana]|uniref:Protein kinase domain-containing protein n=1 Tax=Apodospora peruviana TaxID=516989 RepID=A0AAE0M9Y8_9PEZI|nr:hypothetical protein B0H66DRAFT_587729 [Apodospora peruviana]